MSETNHPSDSGTELYLLTVFGTPRADSFDAARELHNATAGNPAGVAGAKALGDLSHNVFLPTNAEKSLLFLDTWNSPSGVGSFFADAQVIEGAEALFSDRAGELWMPASGFGSYILPVPSGRSVAAVGLMRAPVSSLEAAKDAFHTDSVSKINAIRQSGLVSHQLWAPVAMPGTTPSTEILGVDFWLETDAMNEWYASAEYSALGPVFTGAPATSTWTSAGSGWIEW